MSKIDLSDYVPVAERIANFRAEYPDGNLTSEIVESGHPGFIAVKAYAYRTSDDPNPGIGHAWEPVPGPTPFTKDSELQNAETAAWGRALIAALIADSSRGIASRDEIAIRAPIREDIDPDPGAWLADAVQIFKQWSAEDRRARYTDAMVQLAIPVLDNQKDAKRIFDFMAGVYYEEFPSDETRPF